MPEERFVSIGEVVRDAFLFNPRYWSGQLKSANPHEFPATTQRLFDLLRERRVDYALVGGIAMAKYLEVRNAREIELVMASQPLADFPEIHVRRRRGFVVRAEFGGVRLEVYRADEPLLAEVLRNYTTPQEFAEGMIPTGTVEGLLLVNLYRLPSFYRQGSLPAVSQCECDIGQLAGAYQRDMTPLLDRLAKHLTPNDAEGLQAAVARIEAWIRRVKECQFGLAE